MPMPCSAANADASLSDPRGDELGTQPDEPRASCDLVDCPDIGVLPHAPRGLWRGASRPRRNSERGYGTLGIGAGAHRTCHRPIRPTDEATPLRDLDTRIGPCDQSTRAGGPIPPCQAVRSPTSEPPLFWSDRGLHPADHVRPETDDRRVAIPRAPRSRFRVSRCSLPASTRNRSRPS